MDWVQLRRRVARLILARIELAKTKKTKAAYKDVADLAEIAAMAEVSNQDNPGDGEISKRWGQ